MIKILRIGICEGMYKDMIVIEKECEQLEKINKLNQMILENLKRVKV